MGGIKFEENDCPCLNCMYLVQVTKINEETNGKCDLRINCAISGCPKGVSTKKNNSINIRNTEVHKKVYDCIEMIKRCIELKEIGEKST